MQACSRSQTRCFDAMPRSCATAVPPARVADAGHDRGWSPRSSRRRQLAAAADARQGGAARAIRCGGAGGRRLRSPRCPNRRDWSALRYRLVVAAGEYDAHAAGAHRQQRARRACRLSRDHAAGARRRRARCSSTAAWVAARCHVARRCRKLRRRRRRRDGARAHRIARGRDSSSLRSGHRDRPGVAEPRPRALRRGERVAAAAGDDRSDAAPAFREGRRPRSRLAGAGFRRRASIGSTWSSGTRSPGWRSCSGSSSTCAGEDILR